MTGFGLRAGAFGLISPRQFKDLRLPVPHAVLAHPDRLGRDPSSGQGAQRPGRDPEYPSGFARANEVGHVQQHEGASPDIETAKADKGVPLPALLNPPITHQGLNWADFFRKTLVTWKPKYAPM